MGKKEDDSVLDDFEKLKIEILQEKVNEIFRTNKDSGARIEKMEELGFTYVEDDYGFDEIEEENNAEPENERQKKLVAYFENQVELSEEIFLCFCKEKADENTSLPLMRKYFRAANQNLKNLLIYGLDQYPGRIDLLDDLGFFHEFENILSILMKYYTQACIDQGNLDTFSELVQDFYYATNPDGYEPYYALRDLFEPWTDKRKTIDFLIEDAEEAEKEIMESVDF
jgi:hypothetical protein